MAKFKVKSVGAVDPALQASIDALVASVAALGPVVQSLRDKIKTQMTDAEVAAVKATIDSLAANISAINNDPNNPPAPIPPTP